MIAFDQSFFSGGVSESCGCRLRENTCVSARSFSFLASPFATCKWFASVTHRSAYVCFAVSLCGLGEHDAARCHDTVFISRQDLTPSMSVADLPIKEPIWTSAATFFDCLKTVITTKIAGKKARIVVSADTSMVAPLLVCASWVPVSEEALEP